MRELEPSSNLSPLQPSFSLRQHSNYKSSLRLKLLLQYPTYPSANSLHQILLQHDDIAQTIADATLSHDIDVPMGGQNTALHLASLFGNAELAKTLLERGANPEAKNSKGFTPLSISADPEGVLLCMQEAGKGFRRTILKLSFGFRVF